MFNFVKNIVILLCCDPVFCIELWMYRYIATMQRYSESYEQTTLLNEVLIYLQTH